MAQPGGAHGPALSWEAGARTAAPRTAEGATAPSGGAAGLRAAGCGPRGREEAPGPGVCVSWQPRGARSTATRATLPRGAARRPAAVTVDRTSRAARTARSASGSGFAVAVAAAPRLPFVPATRPEGQCGSGERTAPGRRVGAPARFPRCPGAGAVGRPGRGLRVECGRGRGRGGSGGEPAPGAGASLASPPAPPLLASLGNFVAPPLRTSLADQWSPDLSLKRKLELNEEGACRSPVRGEDLTETWTFFVALPHPGKRILPHSPTGSAGLWS